MCSCAVPFYIISSQLSKWDPSLGWASSSGTARSHKELSQESLDQVCWMGWSIVMMELPVPCGTQLQSLALNCITNTTEDFSVVQIVGLVFWYSWRTVPCYLKQAISTTFTLLWTSHAFLALHASIVMTPLSFQEVRSTRCLLYTSRCV